jgi:hypothetical protein
MLKSRTFLALGLLVVVAGATAYQVTRKNPHVRDSQAASSPLTLQKADIDELEIAEPGKPALVLKNEGGVWKLTQPVADKADQKAVDQAVGALAELKLRDVIAESPDSYEKVGVKDDEVVKVTPKKAGKPLATLLVGKTSNVRLEGDPRVWSTTNLKRWSLVKDVKLWRDRQIMDFPVDQVDTVAVAYPGGAQVVAKREVPPPPAAEPGKDAGAPPAAAGPDKWTLVAGGDKLGGELDANVPLELAGALARMHGDEIVDDAKPEATGLDAPRATVTVTLKDKKTHVLQVGKQDGTMTYVKLADQARVWKIQKYEAERIPASPAQWRDKTIVKLEPESVQKIELLKGEKDKTVLERAGAGWKATTPATLGEVDASRVQAILRGAQGLRATRVLEGADPKTLGLDKPRATATLWTKSGPPVKLAFGTEKDGETSLQITGQKDLYSIPAYLAQPFVKSPDELKKSAGPATPGEPM